MIVRNSTKIRLFIAAIVLATKPVSVRAAVSYAVTDLGTLGGTHSLATAINDDGLVAGYSYISGDSAQHAFLYSASTMMDLGTLGGTYSLGTAINNDGQVAGYSYIVSGETHAFLYSGSTMTDLGTLGGLESAAYGINTNGHVTGFSHLTGGVAQHAFLYNGTAMIDLGTLGGLHSAGHAINDGGQVTGSSLTTDNVAQHAFLYSGSMMTDLGTLPGGTTSIGRAINTSGQVVGTSDGSSHWHAFLYNGSVMIDLGTLGFYSYGYGINDNGHVVGYSYVPTVGDHAFLFDGSMMVDLNTLIDPDLGWTLTAAFDISNTGLITGYGTIDGHLHAFVLTPIPEPATVSVLFVGGMMICRRRVRINRAVLSITLVRDTTTP